MGMGVFRQGRVSQEGRFSLKARLAARFIFFSCFTSTVSYVHKREREKERRGRPFNKGIERWRQTEVKRGQHLLHYYGAVVPPL